MIDDRKRVGTRAEQFVRAHLEAKGYRHLHSNWRALHGELDLVMEDGDELVFVEVKARRTESAGRAEEGVSKKQARILLRTGEMYSQEMNPTNRIWRIDLIAVGVSANGSYEILSHYENAIVVG